ncbi:MAG: tetratricopeptide repeat protein [Candidatus Electrothrix sp. AX1]|nr:tetratricopeptide repeat protein [Candidatus Electrothrix sp. AX1]
MFDENVNIGSHNRAGRDQFINIYGKSKDYQELEHKLAAQERDREKLVRRIKKYPDDEDFQQDLRDCNKQLAKTRKEIEAFKEDVFRLHELFTRIPIDNERLRRAKAHFDKGEFREADAVLKAGEIQEDVERLKLEEKAAADRLAAVRKGLEGRANEFLLKARLSLLNPVAEGEDRLGRTECWFKQALDAAQTAEVLFEYAHFLYDYNAFSRAEPLWQEALQLYRNKAEEDPKAFLPYVAITLNNLANLYQTTKDFGPALAAYEEALKIRRGLTEKELDAFMPFVAGILNNLGLLHSETRDFGPALSEYEEALKIYRELALKEPEAFLPDVAMILNNLAFLHKDTGNFGPALAGYEEALRIRRSLAEKEPDAFLPDLAQTLNNLALLHYETKDFGPALAEYEEALKIRRDLAEKEPDAFLPYVADTLNNLGLLHSDTKGLGPALAAYEEALKLYRGLAEKEPGAFLPDVAMTLNNLAILHWETKDYGPALAEFEESLKLYRGLATKAPRPFSQVLAETLLNLSIFHLKAVPDKDKSVAYAQEARDILKTLIQQAPHLQGHLDHAERLLEANKTQPDA